MSMLAARVVLPAQCPVSVAAERWRDRVALGWQGGAVTYGELDALVGRAAQSMSDGGVLPGEPVALLGPNGVDLIVAIFAVARLRGLSVPLSTRLPAAAAADAARRVGASTVWAAGGTVLAAPEYPPEGLRIRSLDGLAGSGTTSREMVSGRDLDPDRPTIAVFTSGSGGPPKAAALSLSSLMYSALGSNRNLPVGEQDRWLASLPLYHVGGLGILFRCFLTGAAVVVASPSQTLSDAFLTANDISHISLVPTQMLRMIRAAVRVDRFKAILAGGSPVPDGLWDRYVAAGARVYASYGLTEMASQVATTPLNGRRHGAADSGGVLPYRSVRIDGRGQISVRGETLFAGYVEGGRVRSPVTPDGWLVTGDVGRFSPDGHLLVLGRSDNMFVSGGENVQPEEVERALLSLSEVERALVVDVPDQEFGARPVAFVEFGSGELSVGEVSARLDSLLPRFMHPVRILRFPAGTTGTLEKPSRAALRAAAIAGS